MAKGGIFPFFSGKVSKRVLLVFVFPAAFLSYFGSLTAAASLLPGSHDWRSTTISKLVLYPQNDPRYSWIASTGIVLAGVLVIPFAGYIGSRLRSTAALPSQIGIGIFRVGACAAVLTGLIGYHGNLRFPALHTSLARISAFSLGAAMIVFWACALSARIRRPVEWMRRSPMLIECWTLLVILGPSAAVFSTLGAVDRFRLFVGLYEWAASAIFFLFLFSSALLLPD